MRSHRKQRRIGRAAGFARATLTLAASFGLLVGCSDLLEVDLSDAITEETVEDPGAAEIHVQSGMATVECAYSAFVSGNAAGNEDVFSRLAEDVMSGFDEYPTEAVNGTCDTSNESIAWFEPFQTGRVLSEGAYERLTEWSDEEVEDRERLLAISALYAAIPYDVFGEHLCEVTVGGEAPMTPDETLETAEEWVTTALGHIANTGDFELTIGEDGGSPNVIASSIEQMAYGLRARIRWARGPDHWAGAAADAANVEQGFVAYVTRDEIEENDRRNKAFIQHYEIGYATVKGPVVGWTGSPGPGGAWPDPVPFTGYLDLAVEADGRAVEPGGYPVTTAVVGSTPDVRVDVSAETMYEEAAGFRQNKYTSESQDIPLVNWEEIWLIRAEVEGDPVARVNDIRDVYGLPIVTYGPTGDEIDEMIIEERRRSLFLEGRFWSTKIQNTDKLWFPRNQGQAAFGPYEGAVRMTMNLDEYDLNTNMNRADQGTLCAADQQPVLTN